MRLALLIVSLLGFVISLGVFGVSLLLPGMTRGRIDFEEALVGIVPGALCSFVFFVLSIVGLVLVLIQPRQPREARED